MRDSATHYSIKNSKEMFPHNPIVYIYISNIDRYTDTQNDVNRDLYTWK